MEMQYERTQNGVSFEPVKAGDILATAERRGFKTRIVMQDLDNGLERHMEGWNYRATRDSVKQREREQERAKRAREERRAAREAA